MNEVWRMKVLPRTLSTTPAPLPSEENEGLVLLWKSFRVNRFSGHATDFPYRVTQLYLTRKFKLIWVAGSIPLEYPAMKLDASAKLGGFFIWRLRGSQKSRRKEENQLICDIDKGGGVKNSQNYADVIYGSPVTPPLFSFHVYRASGLFFCGTSQQSTSTRLAWLYSERR